MAKKKFHKVRPFLFKGTTNLDISEVIGEERKMYGNIFYCPSCKENHRSTLSELIEAGLVDKNDVSVKRVIFKDAINYKAGDRGALIFVINHPIESIIEANSLGNKLGVLVYELSPDFQEKHEELNVRTWTSWNSLDESFKKNLVGLMPKIEYYHINPFVKTLNNSKKNEDTFLFAFDDDDLDEDDMSIDLPDIVSKALDGDDLNAEVTCPKCNKSFLVDDIVSLGSGRKQLTRNAVYNNKSVEGRSNHVFFFGYDEMSHDDGKLIITTSKDYCISVFDGKVAIKHCNMNTKSGQWKYATYIDREFPSVDFNQQHYDVFSTFIETLQKEAKEKFPYVVSYEHFLNFGEYDNSDRIEKRRVTFRDLKYIAYLSKIINGMVIEYNTWKQFRELSDDFKKFSENPEAVSSLLYDRKFWKLFSERGQSFEKAFVEAFKIKGKKLKNILLNDLSLIYEYRFLHYIFEGNNDLILEFLEDGGLIGTNNHRNYMAISYKEFSSKGFKFLMKFIKKQSKHSKKLFCDSLAKSYSSMINDIGANLLKMQKICNQQGVFLESLCEDDDFRDARSLHDKVSRFVTEHQDSVSFDYDEEKLERLQAENDQYILKLAKNAGELKVIGKEMRICVGSYASRVMDGRCDILYVKDKKEDKYISCIELARKSIVQFKLFANRYPDEESDVFKFVETFANEEKITISRF